MIRQIRHYYYYVWHHLIKLLRIIQSCIICYWYWSSGFRFKNFDDIDNFKHSNDVKAKPKFGPFLVLRKSNHVIPTLEAGLKWVRNDADCVLSWIYFCCCVDCILLEFDQWKTRSTNRSAVLFISLSQIYWYQQHSTPTRTRNYSADDNN